MATKQHTPADYWGPDRCQCEECIDGRVRADMIAAFTRGVLSAMKTLMTGKIDGDS